MNDQIITRDDIRAMAREAFQAGRSRDSHNMNWHAAALPTWLGEYDRLVKVAEVESKRQRVAA
jgi:hypothetical protein